MTVVIAASLVVVIYSGGGYCSGSSSSYSSSSSSSGSNSSSPISGDGRIVKIEGEYSKLLGFRTVFIVHRPVIYKLETTVFLKLDLFPSSGEWETYSVGSLKKD